MGAPVSAAGRLVRRDLSAAFLDLALFFFMFNPFLPGAGRRLGGDAPFFLFQGLFQQGMHLADHLSLIPQLAAMHLASDLKPAFRVDPGG